jgi:hypothetical protein
VHEPVAFVSDMTETGDESVRKDELVRKDVGTVIG